MFNILRHVVLDAICRRPETTCRIFTDYFQKTPHVGLDTVVVPLVSASMIADVYVERFISSSHLIVVYSVMSICMSRFILDLLAITLEDGSSQLRTSEWRTLRFASVVKTATEDLSADLQESFLEAEEYEMHEMASRTTDA